MASEWNLERLVKRARERGYFDPADFPGLVLSLYQFRQLSEALLRAGIRVDASGGLDDMDQRTAHLTLTALRKGVPPALGVSGFSVGRTGLISKMTADLKNVGNGTSLVRFLNADYRSGKTHCLYLLRDVAFRLGFVVSIVTLSSQACPIHNFMAMYDRIMWNLRTLEQQGQPALESVLDKWFNALRGEGEDAARSIIRSIPEDLQNAFHAYYESVSPLKQNEERRLLVLRYLSGEQLLRRDLKRIGVKNSIDEDTALVMLGGMASLFRNLGYRGICIFFDEADPIHSFVRSEHQDRGYGNLLQIVTQSRQAPHCYFMYATTPGFFDEYSYYWGDYVIGPDQLFEIERLTPDELRVLVKNTCKIYSIATGTQVSRQLESLLQKMVDAPGFAAAVGDFIRRCIAILDEKGDAISKTGAPS